jgi:ABC-type transport system involved in multi-copper enzyme maturation permease subunit
MIPNEIERRTIYTILSKPVQRWQFLVGKYLGAVGALGLMMLLMTLVMEVTFIIQMQGVRPEVMVELARAPMMFFVQMSILAAVAIFFSTFVSPLVNFFLSGGTYLVGTLFASFFESINQNAATPVFTKTIAKFIGLILPNFANFNIQNPIINPGQTIQNPTAYYLQATAYGLFYIGILLVGGIMILDRREV